MNLKTEEIKVIAELPYSWEKIKDKTILVSGGTGFIGTAFVDVIKYRNQKYNENIKVISFSRRGGESSEYLECIKANVKQPLHYEGKIDYIIHLASNTHPKQYAEDPIGTIMTNIYGCDNLLKLAVKKLLYDAEVDHCLSFEQVSDEVIEYYKIKNGDFDTISSCKYSVPSYLDIGKLYSIMIEDCARPGDEVRELMKIFTSFISDKISDFNTDLYYQNPDYLEWSYREGKLLD